MVWTRRSDVWRAELACRSCCDSIFSSTLSLLGFNVDPAFGDALDALMMVDLTRVPVRTLQRYLGRRDAATFLAHHQRETDRPVVAA